VITVLSKEQLFWLRSTRVWHSRSAGPC